jgi:hypothetical protein
LTGAAGGPLVFLVLSPQRREAGNPQSAGVLDRRGAAEALEVAVVPLDVTNLELVAHADSLPLALPVIRN